MGKTVKNEKGMAIITVLITFLTIFILLAAITMLAVNNQATTKKSNDYSKAYYVAESALNIRTTLINQMFQNLAIANQTSNLLFSTLEYDYSTLPIVLSFPETSENDSAVVTLTKVTAENSLYPTYVFYKFTSKGTVNGVSRSLSKEVGFGYIKGGPGFIIGKAILTQRSMVFSNGLVVGPVASNVLDGTTISIKSLQAKISEVLIPTGRTTAVLDPTKVTKITEVPKNFLFPIIEPPLIPTTQPIVIAPPTYVNDSATINVSSFSYLENLTMAGGQTLIIDLGSKGTSLSKKILKVKNINASGNIRVIGTGRLLLVFEYGPGTLTLGSKFTVCGNVVGRCPDIGEESDFTKFLFYLKTPNVTAGDIANYRTLEFGNLQWFHGSILGQYVNVSVKSSNFRGHIVTSGNTVDFAANATINQTLFYAPFAKVTIGSNSHLLGSIVANTFEMSSPDTIVKYIEVNRENFPFTISFPEGYDLVSGYDLPGNAIVIEGNVTEG